MDNEIVNPFDMYSEIVSPSLCSPSFLCATNRIRVKSDDEIKGPSLSGLTLTEIKTPLIGGGKLFMSDSKSAKQTLLLKNANISYILNCTIETHTFTSIDEETKESCEELQLRVFDSKTEAIFDITYLRCPLYDLVAQSIFSHGKLNPIVLCGINFINKAIKEGSSILVHCHKGESRSATLILLFLMYHNDFSLKSALRLVAAHRSSIRPNDGFFNALIDFEVKGLGREQSFTFQELFCSLCGCVCPAFVSIPLSCGHGSCCSVCLKKFQIDGENKMDPLLSSPSYTSALIVCSLCKFSVGNHSDWD